MKFKILEAGADTLEGTGPPTYIMDSMLGVLVFQTDVEGRWCFCPF